MNLHLVDEDHPILTEMVPEIKWIPDRVPADIPDYVATVCRGPLTDYALFLKGHAQKLLDFLWLTGHRGLAANQVGLSLRMCVIVVGWPMTFINPTIIETMGVRRQVEGCLSFPGYRIAVNRPQRIIVESSTLFGTRVTETFCGMLAGVVAHSIDHLDGMTILDAVHQKPLACL